MILVKFDFWLNIVAVLIKEIKTIIKFVINQDFINGY